MSKERIGKRNLRDVSFAATIALMMTLTGFVSLSPRVSATPDVLRMLTTTEWDLYGPTGLFSVTAADLDGDGSVEVIVGGTSYQYPVWPVPPEPPGNWPRGYLAVFHYGGCMKTLDLLDQKAWSAAYPNEDTMVFSVVIGDFDKSQWSPGYEIVTAGYTMVGPLFRGELRMYKWIGATQTLQFIQGSSETWPDLPWEPNTYAYSAFAANVDIDSDIEIVTAGSYGNQLDLRVWSWTVTGFFQEASIQSLDFMPAAWKGVSAGDIDGYPQTVEIVTVGYGTIPSDTISVLQIWRKVGSALVAQLPVEHYWSAPGQVATANSTYVGPLDSSGNVRILTVGSAKNSVGDFEQEMKIFDWPGVGFPLEEKISKLWVPPDFSQAWGTGTYASYVDTDGQIEMLAVGLSPGYADLSIWHWDGERPPDPPYPIELETHITWASPYPFARADAVYVSNANGDLDNIPEIVTAGTITHLIIPPPPWNPLPSRKGQLRMWDWNLPIIDEWSPYNPNLIPSGREEHAMAYHSVAERTIMFGGERTGGVNDDTWQYDARTHEWNLVQLVTGGSIPSARREHAMVYVTARNRVVLFGGADASNNYFRDTWEFEYGIPDSEWREITPAPGSQIPTARYAPGMAYDEAHDVTILFGGMDYHGIFPTDIYAFDYGTSTWSRRSPTGGPPDGRVEHAMAYDAKRDRIVLFGGSRGATFLSDVWEYEYDPGGLDRWIPAPASPSARSAPAMSYDAQGEVVVLFGGYDGNIYLDDTWAYDGVFWNLMSPAISPPSRYESAMVYDLHANRNVLFGGYDIYSMDDTWEYRYS